MNWNIALPKLVDPSGKRAAHAAILKAASTGLFALNVASLVPDAPAAAVDYTIDSAHTSASFEVRSFAHSTQRGSFNDATGSVSLDAQAGNGRMDIVIDARSVHADNAAVERVMRSKGLFNVEQYPEIEYKAERVEFANGEPDRIDGELTLLGVTKAVPLTVTGYACRSTPVLAQQRCMVDATATFKRSEFGMTGYRSLASDDVQLAIQAEVVEPEV